MKQRIIEIIKELREVIKEECLSISHDALFSEAISCYRGEQAGKPKTFPTNYPTQNSPNEIATEKQKNFIYKNNMNVDTKELTKNEAKSLIKEYIQKNNKNDK